MPWVPSRGSCCVGAGLRADPGGPCIVVGERGSGAEPVPSHPALEWAAVSPWGLRGTLGSLRQLYPPLFSPSAPAQVQRGGENMLETGPPNHVGEPPCSSPAGDKDLIVRPTDTPLSTSRRRGPWHRLTPLPEALELLYSATWGKGAQLLRAGRENEGRR